MNGSELDPAAGEEAGGVAATHLPLEEFEVRASTATTGKGFNTIREELRPVACWRMGDVRFEFDSSILLPGARVELQKLAQLRAAHPGSPLSLFGHADPIGDDNYNKELSGRRSRCVHALLTRDTAAWETLYNTPIQGSGDCWKYKAVQVMLAALGHDPGPITGTLTAKTVEAVKSFQRSVPITDDGDPGPTTRGKLFPLYMDFLAVDTTGTPFIIPKAGFLAGGADAGGKGDLQGCSEFNPVLMFSQAENQAFQAPAKKQERDKENAPNRRILGLLFRAGTVIDPAKWPCPRVSEGIAGCQKRFWSDASTRRQFQVNRRKFADTHDTFACRFYHRLVENSPCEGGKAAPPPVILVNPIIAPAALIVVVKKPHTNPARKPVVLSTSAPFTGTGKLTRSSASVRFFTAAVGGTEIAFNDVDNVFAGAQLDAAGGVTVHAEHADGTPPSAALNDITITLTLTGPNAGPPATATITAVEITLDVHQSRTAPATDPTALTVAEKINPGRFVHVQFDQHHGRAMLTVRQAQPAAFAGNLTVTPIDAKVQLFADEVPAAGQAALANPHVVANTAIPAAGLQLFAEGVSVSGGLIDTGFRLGIQGDEPDGDHVAMTVVQFKKITADIPSTPANIVRNRATGAGSNSPVLRHVLPLADPPAAANFDEDFTTNLPVALIEGSVRNADPIKLSVEIEPNDPSIRVRWSAQRDHSATGDHPDIIAFKGNDDLTLTPDPADNLKADLLLDNVGSFHIRPFVDCNLNDTFEGNDAANARIDREPFILMNLVIIRVEGVANNIVTRSAAGSPTIIFVGGRPSSVSTGDFAATGNDAITMDATARVVGGGQDGLRGLNLLFGGWCNNLQNTPTSPGPGALGTDVTHHHRRPIPPPGPGPAPPPPPLLRTRSFFEMDGVEITCPLLDSGAFGGAGTQGTGGNTCTSTTAPNDCPVTKTPDASGVGERWRITNVDSPGVGILDTSNVDPLATVRRFTFNIDFRCDLVFWTNRNAVSGPDDSPAVRLYVSVSTNTWNTRLESTFDDAFTETVVVPKTIAAVLDGNHLATPVEASLLETRAPDALDHFRTHVPF